MNSEYLYRRIKSIFSVFCFEKFRTYAIYIYIYQRFKLKSLMIMLFLCLSERNILNIITILHNIF